MRRMRLAAGLCALAILAVIPLESTPVSAEGPSARRIEVRFTPTARAQIALWIESADGTIFQTLKLTQAVALRGIGNRPGATQMNSGFRWPYGRREGVLPVWAHRRATAQGTMFPRVIFQDRTSEGAASRTSNDASPDDYFCLSFMADRSRRDQLDAVSCASVFNSDKGRYMTPEDVSGGYAEPFEMTDGTEVMRPLSLQSLYPPRRDVARCTAATCADHVDVDRFATDVRTVMPDIDAITMATPPGDSPWSFTFTLPDAWPEGDYVLWVEANVEGDYNDVYNDTSYPTPDGPDGRWDYWAMTYGYPYRGQPSVVYRVPFRLSAVGGEYTVVDPDGYTAMHGETGDMIAMDGRITDEPSVAPGSGADRLRVRSDGSRVYLRVIPTNVCFRADPPPECGRECDAARPCSEGFICAPDSTCVGLCDVEMNPGEVQDLTIEPHSNVREAHHFAHMSFRVPEAPRTIGRYEVRVSTSPITDEASFMAALPANAASLDSVALVVPSDGAAGDLVEVDLGGLVPETRYWIGIRAVDECNDEGPIGVGEVTTTKVYFTTVSPCFVATAAFGSPMAAEVDTLRRFRDSYLMTNAAGRLAVDAYYAVGPYAADVIRGSELLRAAARGWLAPYVVVAKWLE